MTHGSLFSGIGGFDLAAHWMGWENKFHCEINPFCQKVLSHYWPDAELFTDIKKTDFGKFNGSIDIISGGFPCQPYSSAGKRLGKEDDRHLWPEMLRCIREVGPRWVVGENVRGLTNWNGGVVFDEVQADLESQGYEVTPFLLPACAVDAPHRRDRIWFIAYAGSKRRQQKSGSSHGDEGQNEGRAEKYDHIIERDVEGRDVTNANQFNGYLSGFRASEVPQLKEAGVSLNTTSNSPGERFRKERPDFIGSKEWHSRASYERATSNSESGRWRLCLPEDIGSDSREEYSFSDSDQVRAFRRRDWERFPTQSPICVGNDGLPARLDGITVPKWRNESIKAAGNAIVPQVVYQIFKAIGQYENLNK